MGFKTVAFTKLWVKIKSIWSYWAYAYRKIPKYLDTRKIAVIILKFVQCVSTNRVMSPTDADRMATSVDPDQTLLLEQSDLGLHCLPRPTFLKT